MADNLPNYTPVGALGTRHTGIKRLPDEASQFFDDERLLDEGGDSEKERVFLRIRAVLAAHHDDGSA